MKSQVTVEYEKLESGRIVPLRVDTVLVSIQHNPDITNEEIKEQSIEKVFKAVIPEKYLND